MGIREQIEKVIRDESGSYQLMAGKMRAIDLDRCEEAFIYKILSLISEAKGGEANIEKDSGWIDSPVSLQDSSTGMQYVLQIKGEMMYMFGSYNDSDSVLAYWTGKECKYCRLDRVVRAYPLPQPPKSEEVKAND